MAMALPSPNFESLVATISESSSAITSFLKSNNLPTPSFDENGPVDLPQDPEVQGARLQLLGALTDMFHLAMGPAFYSLLSPVWNNHDEMTIDVLNQFDFFSAVPLGGSATYSEISRTTNLPESVVRRILRYAFTMRLFAATEPGSESVVHTATTAYLAKTPAMRSMIGHNVEEVRAGSVHFVESLKKFSAGKANLTEEIIDSGFAIADIDRTGHPVDYWTYAKVTPEGKPEGFREKRFAEAMQAGAGGSSAPTELLIDNFDWTGLDEGRVIDVGGSSGHDAVLLAKAFPNLSFIVQDRPELEPAVRSYVPQELSPRITFQPHNFFNLQTEQADVYLLKRILHDWPDKYVVQILKNLVHKLKPNSRILLFESMFPNAAVQSQCPPAMLRMLGAIDLQMITLFNSLERSYEQWQDVIKRADERFEVRLLASTPDSLRGILEIRLT